MSDLRSRAYSAGGVGSGFLGGYLLTQGPLLLAFAMLGLSFWFFILSDSVSDD